MKNYREVKIGPYSAYAIAKKNGFEGTEEEWLESLKPPAVDKTLTEEGQAADAKVTGDALATKAVIDDAAVGTDAWSSKRIIDTLCPPISETGNPVRCSPVASYPLGCKVSWEPVQEGSGTPSPENIRPIKGRDSITVTRCGENLLNPSLFQNNKYQNFNAETGYYEIDSSNDYWITGIQPCLPSTTYHFNVYTEGGCFYDEKKNVIGIAGFEFTVKTPAKCAYYCVNFSSVRLPYGSPVIATVGESTTYSPYTGQTATLSLPRTIYGGTVDAVTGEGQETWKLVTLDGTGNWETWGVNENNAAVTGFYNYSINDYDPNCNKLLCSTMPYKNVDVWGGRNEGIGYARALNLGSRYMIYNVKTDTLSDASDNASAVASFKSYLAAQYAAGTPVQIAYRRAEPVPFTATGAQPIPSFPGVNTLLTNADSVTVTGRADPIKRITDLEDAVASMTTN